MRLWNSFGLQHLGDEVVCLEEHVGVEDDVVDADDAVPAQRHVVHVRGNPVQGEPERPVHVMVEVGARGDDPVHESGFHEGNERREPQTRRA